MGELVDLSDQFAERGRQETPSLPELATVQYIDFEEASPITDAGFEDFPTREDLIFDATQALFDHYDISSMAEYCGATDAELAELKQRKEECLALLNDDERDQAFTKFREAIGQE